MPRSRPDSVSTQRLELGSFEREYLKDTGLARGFSTFYDALFGSPTKLLATTTIGVAAVYAAFPKLREYLDENVIDDFLAADDVKGLNSWVKDITQTQNIIGGVIGFGLGGPIGLILSQLVVEKGEDVVGGIGDAIGNFGNENVPIGLPISIILTLKKLEQTVKRG